MILAFLLFIIIGSVFALDVGKVDSFSGKVDKLQRGQVKPQPLTQENIGLSVGDTLRTKSDGTAKVSFIDGNNVELGPLTRVSLSIDKYPFCGHLPTPRV